MQSQEISQKLRISSLTRDLKSQDEHCRSNAYRDILHLADDGYGDAMFQVARCLNLGLGVETNQEKADYWLRRACSAKPASASALYTYGMQHLSKKRPDADVTKGISYIERAASSGLVKAILQQVSMVENGMLNIKPDLHRAFRLLATATANIRDAQLHKAYLSFCERHQPISNLLDS